MFNLDVLIFVAFLLINLIVGIKYRGKKQSFKEYAVGNKDFSTAVLTTTIVATWASGSMLFSGLEQTYSNGLYYMLPVLVGSTFSWLIYGYIIAPRMGNLLNHVSMADAMSSIYGKGVQFIIGLSTLLGNVGIIAVQFKVISKVLSVLFNYQGSEVTIIAASIIIIYSAFGGIRAVTFTDVIQFITFGTLLPVLALVIWQHIPDHSQVMHTLITNPNFNLSQTVKASPRFMDTLALICYFSIPRLAPELFQRMAMARDVGQVRRSIIYSTGLLILIRLFISWIGILLLSENTDLKINDVVSYMVEKHTYTGLKGFLAVGIIALAMSTADSALNSYSVLVANDILPTLGITKQASVRVAAMATFVIGFFAILLALSLQNILQILFLSANFIVPITTVPMLLTIFGFRTSKRVIYIGIGAGFVVTAFLLLYFKNINSFVPGMLANLVFLLGSHYLLKEKGGWIKPETGGLGIQQAYSFTWKDRWEQVKNFKLLAYLEKCLPNKEHYYPLLAFYLLTATYVSLYHIPYAVEQQYLTIYRIIQYSILAITTSLLGFPIWPATLKNKRILAWLWPLIIFYTLFFVGGILVIMSGFQSNQVLIFMLNLVMTVLLSSWQLSIALAGMGIIAAVLVSKRFLGGVVGIYNVMSIPFQLGYGLLLFSSTLIALFRFKQANQTLENTHAYLRVSYQETTKQLVKALNTEERFVKALEIEGVKELENTVQQGKELERYITYANNQSLAPDFKQTLTSFKDRITSTVQYLSMIVHRATTYLQLQVTTISLKQLVYEVMEGLQLMELAVIPQVTIKMEDNLEAKILEADTRKLEELLLHAIAYAQSKLTRPQQLILLGIEESLLGYATNSIQGYVKEVAAIRLTVTTLQQLPIGERLYLNTMEKSVVDSPIDQNNFHLLLNQRILQAHYGYMAIEVNRNDITQVYVIPQQIREVRPKEMDIPEFDPEAILQLSDEAYPGAKKQEDDFLKTLQLESPEQLSLVHKAIRFIKKYHGPVKRKSGEPFYLHPIMVAKIVATYTQDIDTILGALLHDIVEDTAVTLPQIELMFNADVRRIVDGVTHLDSLSKVVYRLRLGEHENIEQLLEAEDKRILYVKLADRTHNMRTIQFHSSINRQKQIAEETLNFFVPVAKYLGLMQTAAELKAISSEVLRKKE